MKIIKGENIRSSIPDSALENVKLSFADHGLNFEKDLQYCELHFSDKGTCWLHDSRNKTPFWKGTLIANFLVDGSRFWFTKNVNRNTEKLERYQKERANFFKKERTAGEFQEFEKRFIE